MIRKLKMITTGACIALLLAACDNAGHSEPFEWPENTNGQSPFYGETLTIASAEPGRNWAGAEIHGLARVVSAYMWANPGVTIQMINFDISADGVSERFDIEMMAGTAPVLIDSVLVDHLNPITAQLLANWYPIMAAAPNFNEDDWFMNVFDTFATNGQLRIFPTHFNYRFIQANSFLPEFVQALEAKDNITVAQMQQMHRELATTDMPLDFMMNFDVFLAIRNYLDYFLDIDSGMVNFDNQQFIDLITYAKNITAPDRRFESYIAWVGYTRTLEHEWALEYLFMNTRAPFQFHYYLDLDRHRSFAVPTPLVNDRGELLAELTEGFALNAGATQIQKALAWDFVYFTANYLDRSQFGLHQMQPTNRNLLYATVERWLPDIRAGYVRQGWLQQEDEQADIESVMARMTTLAEMPMSSVGVPNVVLNAITEIVGQFHDGLITAEQAAQDLQNRITLILMEMS